MKLKSHDLLSLHLPRWEDFPAFELYIDQVLAFINDNLTIFNQGDDPFITPAMINNYVKNGVLHAPIKKKYNRDHLAKLVVICIAKRMLSISDISEAIAIMSRSFEVGEGYNLLCDEIEYEILSTFEPEKYPPRTIISAQSRDIVTMRSLASAVAKILVFDRIVSQRRRLSQLTAKMMNDTNK